MFTETSYVDASGKSNKVYQMNRDGFIFLVTSFKGTKADLTKLAFIEAFNHYEELAMAAPVSDELDLEKIGTTYFNNKSVNVLMSDNGDHYCLFSHLEKVLEYKANASEIWIYQIARVVGHILRVVSLDHVESLLEKHQRETKQMKLVADFYQQESTKGQESIQGSLLPNRATKVLQLIEAAKASGKDNIIPDLIAAF